MKTEKFFQELKTVIRQIVEGMVPEVSREALAWPIKAKVEAVHLDTYSLDVKPVRNDGSEWKHTDKDGTEHLVQTIKSVPMDTVSGSGPRGVYGLPVVGSIVRVSFYGGDPLFPFVDAVLNDKAPMTEAGELSLYRDADHHVRLKPDGTLAVTAPGDVMVDTGGICVITAKKATINADEVNLAGEGGKGVVCVDHVCNFSGLHTKGSTKVKAK